MKILKSPRTGYELINMTIIFIGIFLVLDGSVLNASELPTSPQNPTAQDCQQLSKEYYRIILDLHKQVNACFKQPTKFGIEKNCSGRYESLAWVQCNYIDIEICKVKESQKEQVSICKTRIVRDNLNEKSNENIVQSLSKWNDSVSKIETAFDKTKHFITDPSKFLLDESRKALQDKAYDYVVDKIFGQNHDKLEDPSLGNELYKTISKFGSLGISSTSDPIVRAIQQETFKLLSNEYIRTLDTLNELDVKMKYFSNEKSVQSKVKQKTTIKPDNNRDDCSLLNDENLSRSLQETNREKWISLIGKCKK